MHFVAGPWFAVHRSGDDWQKLDQIWISNGETDIKGRIEIRVEMERPDAVASETVTTGIKPLANSDH